MGPTTRAFAAIAVVFGVVVGAGCAQPRDAFQCSSSSECVHAGQAGTCEPTGFCSFDDRGCPSGKRYGESAGDDLADQCVINPNGDFIIASVVAVNHISIAVTFSHAPDPTAAVDLANYTVDGLTLTGTPTLAGNVVTIATAEQADTTYNATVANIARASDAAPLWMGTATFKGRPEFKVTGAVSATNGLAQVMFSGPPDMTTAASLANYSIPGLTLSGAPIVVGNTVTLVTSPQSATSYTVTVTNIVRAGDSEALTNNMASFTGRLGFNVVSASAPNSATVVVTFDAPPNATQGATLANFSIPGLTLSGVPVVAGNTITLTTSPQASQSYTVTVSNVTRASDGEPLINAAANFTGVNTFNVASATPTTSNNVQVTFDAPPNIGQATTLGNYSIPTLTPTAVAYPGTGNVVTLTVPAMSATTYTVTVNNVTRASDAEPLANKTATFTGRPKFNVVSATSLSSTSIRITFDGPPSATNGVVLGNYSVDNGLALSGTPVINGNTVTIATAPQSALSYTVTVTGVTRSGDNEPLLTNTATFTGRTPFNVVSALATSSTKVSVTFDGPPGAGATTATNYSIPTLSVSAATYPGTGNVVTLTTAPQTGGMYTLTVNNVTRAGDLEPLANKTATFTGRLPFNVSMAQATSSTQVEVTFSAAPNATQAGTVGNYFISGLAISAVSVTGNVATLTTAAQSNTSYTVVVSNVTRGTDGELLMTNSATFTGRTPFNVSTASPVSSTSLAVTFSGPPGAGATTASNYTITGLAVSAAAYPGTGNIGTLTTAAQSNASYTLTVNNVTRAGDLEPLTNKTATFTGRPPFNVTAAAPTLNTRITVTFDAPPNSGQANTASNYVLSGGLMVTSVNYTSGNTVTVNTSAQTGGTNYTVTVNNVTRTDGEALTTKTANFTGRAAFNVTGATSVGNTSVSVTFSAQPGTGATTLGNYMITSGSLSLSGTPVVSGNTVTITTSTQTAGSPYTITVSNVLRTGDNEPLTTASASFTGKAGFNVASATSVNHNTVSVTFDAQPIITEAQTESNYTFSGGLMTNGTPVLVGNTVTIPTTNQAGQLYTVTVNNVHRFGDSFALSVNTANFTHTLFNVTTAISTNTHSVDVTFDAPPNESEAETMGNYTFSGGVVPTGAPVLNGSTVTIPTSDQVSGSITVTVANVTRASDGTILSNAMASFAGRTPFTISAMSTSSGTISVTYSDPPVVAAASLNTNYSASGGLTLSSPSLTSNTVTFNTTAQNGGTYTVTVINVTRLSDGEPLTTNTANFTGTALSMPVVTNVVVTATNPNNSTTFYNTGTATVTITGSEFTGVSCPAGLHLDDTNGIGGVVDTQATSCSVNGAGTQITATFPSGVKPNYSGWNVKVTNAVGTNTTSTVKLIVKAGIVVSEFLTHAGGGNGADHEFIELYNPTATALNLQTLGFSLHIRNATGSTDTALTPNYSSTGSLRNTIPSHGFFLLESTGTGNSDPWNNLHDAQYSTASVDLVDNGGLYISLSSTANLKVCDKVGWGTQPATGYEGTALPNISQGFSVQRKFTGAGGTVTDTDVNSTDFNAQSTLFSLRNTGSAAQP